jgi:hypothetical protein
MSTRLPPPDQPEEFERLCRDLWADIWGDVGAQRNGRSGQKQAGVDFYGQRDGLWKGVQCKKKSGALRTRVTVRELEREVAAARKFNPALTSFVLATTGPRDVGVQQRARELCATAGFTVEVLGWEEICAELDLRHALLERIFPVYWPQLASLGAKAKSRAKSSPPHPKESPAGGLMHSVTPGELANIVQDLQAAKRLKVESDFHDACRRVNEKFDRLGHRGSSIKASEIRDRLRQELTSRCDWIFQCWTKALAAGDLACGDGRDVAIEVGELASLGLQREEETIMAFASKVWDSSADHPGWKVTEAFNLTSLRIDLSTGLRAELGIAIRSRPGLTQAS